MRRLRQPTSRTVPRRSGVVGLERRCDAGQEVTMSNVHLVKSLYEAFGRGDMATVLGGMDPAIEWHEAESNPYMPSGDAWVGPDAVLQNLFMKLGADWDRFTVHPRTFHDAGDTVVVEGRYTGTCKATGKAFDSQMCHVWRLRDGKATRFQQYVDTARLHEVMGVPLSA
jgi:ketosteroid isomerase-like protein